MVKKVELKSCDSKLTRQWLESCREAAQRISPEARYALGPAVLEMYGPVAAADIESERGLMEYVLRFANGDIGPRSDEADRRRWQLRENFVYIHNSGNGAVLGNYMEVMLQDVWLLPVLDREPQVRLSTLWVVTEPRAFDALTAVLLLDQDRPFGAGLCQCRLPECGRFFLERKPETGRPQRRYCSAEHMLESNSRTSTARALKSRAKAKAKAAKRRR